MHVMNEHLRTLTSCIQGPSLIPNLAQHDGHTLRFIQTVRVALHQQFRLPKETNEELPLATVVPTKQPLDLGCVESETGVAQHVANVSFIRLHLTLGGASPLSLLLFLLSLSNWFCLVVVYIATLCAKAGNNTETECEEYDTFCKAST